MSATKEGLLFPSPEVSRCPYPHLQRARAEFPVARVPGRNEYLVTLHDDVRDVLSRPEVFSSTVAERRPDGTICAATLDYARSDLPRPIQQSDPPVHTAKRRLAFEFFKPARLPQYEPMIRRVIDDLIDGFIGRGEVEFVSEFATPLPARVIHNVLGLPESDSKYAEVWGSFEGQATRYHDPERQAKIAASIRDMGGYVVQAVTERYEQPRDDVLSEFVAGHVAMRGEFILPEVVGDATNLFLGGIVTTSHMLGWTMWMLLGDPERSRRAVADRAVAVRAIEEALRIEPPVPWTSRLALEDTEIAGVPVPAGAIVICHLGSANHDERHFADPETFKLERENVKDHLSFGLKTHFCIGAPGAARGKACVRAAVRASRRIGARRAKRRRDRRQHGVPRTPRAVPGIHSRVRHRASARRPRGAGCQQPGRQTVTRRGRFRRG
jgi:cytochrome P450